LDLNDLDVLVSGDAFDGERRQEDVLEVANLLGVGRDLEKKDKMNAFRLYRSLNVIHQNIAFGHHVISFLILYVIFNCSADQGKINFIKLYSGLVCLINWKHPFIHITHASSTIIKQEL